MPNINSFELVIDRPLSEALAICVEAARSNTHWKIFENSIKEDRFNFEVPPDVNPLNTSKQPYHYIIQLVSESPTRTRVIFASEYQDRLSGSAILEYNFLKSKLKALIQPAKSQDENDHSINPDSSPDSVQTQTSSIDGVFLSQKSSIFISYRREDSADVTGRIHDQLLQHFDRGAIFKDVDTIPFGLDFREVIRNAVGHCQILVVIIGRDWLTVTDEHGERRLDNPADFVRIEVETALSRDIPVVPVLVRGASMPKEIDLPESLKLLSYRNAINVRSDPDFHNDMRRLINGLQQLFDYISPD